MLHRARVMASFGNCKVLSRQYTVQKLGGGKARGNNNMSDIVGGVVVDRRSIKLHHDDITTRIA